LILALSSVEVADVNLARFILWADGVFAKAFRRRRSVVAASDGIASIFSARVFVVASERVLSRWDVQEIGV
jgi:hypothetical protein